jgi:hypothetical protein
MSENQEPHQIGRLAEEYARLKDEVYRVEERVERARRAYQVAAISFADIAVHEDRLTVGSSGELGDCATANLQNLLGTRELIELFHERSRLRHELDEVRGKLRGWLTHI